MSGNYCTYCGSSRRIEYDHIKPKSKGGVTTTEACMACNRSKGNKSLLQWLRWIRVNDPYRWRMISNYHYAQRGKIAQIVHQVRDEIYIY
jgi:hypothetical protein